MSVETEKKPMEELPFDHKRVLSIIPDGLENSITCKDIEKLTGLSSVKIRQIINQLVIKYGFVVGASNKPGMQGFYIPNGEQEELLAILNLRSRRLAIIERERALINNVANSYQMDLLEDIE